QGDNTVSIGGWGNVPPKPYKPTICLRILLALENEDPTLNKYPATRAAQVFRVLGLIAPANLEDLLELFVKAEYRAKTKGLSEVLFFLVLRG
ncbi:hypothetical protein, partial [Vacuolonema iberomarrocanum]|uniref:hypothetical protein n=1 Tax=Vacuolonema iberomarrocanum TaxID=3454632 RepID=UPI003F6DDC75